ncbi:TPA: hypothetical protein OKD72_004118 [Escherichia coli]|nr:hypothetical protein [Escherichia coli]HCQ3813146.1 hypothetical protein [Escherichia coli]HCQ3844976.1 hypothetical protein [Escherichia coli]
MALVQEGSPRDCGDFFVTLFQYAADIHCILAVAFFLSKGSYAAKWHLNRSQFGIRIDHDLAAISDHSLASQSITIWHASDH